jgi:putative nucleotidyltransferase with HDIG domain
MTESHYTPQMLVATLCVLLLPAGLVWILHSRGAVDSFWLGVLVGLAVTLIVLTIGTAYWRRRRHPATVLFSELLVWGWIRRQYLDHKIGTALRSLAELHPDDSARRTQLLTEIAAAVEAKDPFLYGHSRRVARYVMRVARRMHLDRSDVGRVRTAALLHDVGKLHTPPEVLLQPRRLDAEETAVMRRHAEDGAEMVAALGDRNLADVVRHHHERFDGTGYPTGLEGDAIPLGSRIIAVPDTFDAITTTRPYRPGLPHNDALTVLRDEAGKQFDPAVVRAFLAEYTDRGGAMIWAAAEQLNPRSSRWSRSGCRDRAQRSGVCGGRTY